MNKIEGFKISITAGPYETKDENTWLKPDYAETIEITCTHDYWHVDDTIKEAQGQVREKIKEIFRKSEGTIFRNK